MALGLQHIGLNLRTASMVVAWLAMFFAAYRIIKDVILVTVLNDIDITNAIDDDYDYPLPQVPTLKKVLYGDVTFSGIMFLSSLFLLLGILRNIRVLIAWWCLIAVAFICVDLGVTIYLAIIYIDLNSIAWAMAINFLWYLFEIYFICVVLAYYKSVRGDGEDYNIIT